MPSDFHAIGYVTFNSKTNSYGLLEAALGRPVR